MSIGGRTAKVVAAAAFATGIFGLNAAPASAAFGTWYVYQGDDYAVWYGGTGFVGACDMEADGHSVYAKFFDGQDSILTVWDTNGSRAGCGNAGQDVVTYNARFKVCESVTGPDWCSPWRYMSDGHLE